MAAHQLITEHSLLLSPLLIHVRPGVHSFALNFNTAARPRTVSDRDGHPLALHNPCRVGAEHLLGPIMGMVVLVYCWYALHVERQARRNCVTYRHNKHLNQHQR